ncbi:MAG: hypothetical protein H0W67_09810 [Gemmatimonadales bacterium]|nr:hypothetical protein [Gemmatimonadales bacterium]
MARNLVALGLLTAFSVATGTTGLAQNRTSVAAATLRVAAGDSTRAGAVLLDSVRVTSSRANSISADSARKAREVDVAREAFAYGGGGRDPFVSLINSDKSGPEIGELQLVGVYENLQTPSRSVVVLREKIGGKRHKLWAGDRLGRLQLVQIRPKDAVFVIQDFGIERRETLSLRKQEDATP